MEDSPLRLAAIVQATDWSRELSAHSLGEAVPVLAVAHDTSNAAWERFEGAQVRSLERRSADDVYAVSSALAGLVPAHYQLFVYSFSAGIILWQDQPAASLVRLAKVSADEEVFFDPSKTCPLGHPMPAKNKHETLEDFFIVSDAEQFDDGARRYEAQLEQFFSLAEADREAWLDTRDLGLGSGSHAQRLDPLMTGGSRFRRCTGRCGYFFWAGAWYRDVARRS